MQMCAFQELLTATATRRWSGFRARCIYPRKYLCMLPALTRPTLFGGD
jgi:hypothetical protein